MNRSAILVVLFLQMAVRIFAADGTDTNESEAVQWEKLYQRHVKEMRDLASKAPTNEDVSYITNSLNTPFDREQFNQMVVHPSFGLHWDEVPAPTMGDSNAMATVDAFIATNGWDMQKDNGRVLGPIDIKQCKRISGLPWKVIHDREFPAITRDGTLFIWFTGWHHNDTGIAYNPKRNTFSRGIAFKPIGQHWYVWATSDSGDFGPHEYEGANKN
jgi:hypothetical protein